MSLIRKKWIEFLAWILKKRACYVLHKFRPLVVAVTGSVGKSSTKEAIYAVIAEKYPVMRNQGNLNNELGVPLSIIRKKKPQGVINWIKFVFNSGAYVAGIKEYPAYLVLELATDKKGDIKYLCDMVQPTIGVVTNVGESHMEFFGNVKKTVIEKRSLIESLPKEGRAVLNYDDENVLSMKKYTKAKVISYGLKKGADIVATNVAINLKGTSFKLVYNGSIVPVNLQMVGCSYVRSALAAVAVGLTIGMDVMDIVSGLQKWEPLPGRMRIVEGKNQMIIFDDSYNASPDSVINAIESLKLIPLKERKVAILGSMWELGKATRKGHLEIGKRAGRYFDLLLCVEEFGDIIKEGAMQSGFDSDKIIVFKDTSELLGKLDGLLKTGDVVLVKGSQGKNRLEKVVKKIMKYPKMAKEILVRQSDEWLKK